MLHVAWLLTMKPFGGQKLTPREKVKRAAPEEGCEASGIRFQEKRFFSNIYPPEHSHENGKPII